MIRPVNPPATRRRQNDYLETSLDQHGHATISAVDRHGQRHQLINLRIEELADAIWALLGDDMMTEERARLLLAPALFSNVAELHQQGMPLKTAVRIAVRDVGDDSAELMGWPREPIGGLIENPGDERFGITGLKKTRRKARRTRKGSRETTSETDRSSFSSDVSASASAEEPAGEE